MNEKLELKEVIELRQFAISQPIQLHGGEHLGAAAHAGDSEILGDHRPVRGAEVRGH